MGRSAYAKASEALRKMKKGETKFIRVGRGSTGVMGLRKGDRPKYKDGSFHHPEPAQRRSKIIKPGRGVSVGSTRG